jgi:DNA-binding transcriptional ArsR family regulator
MGTSKSALFNQQQNELANLAKSLSHPARIAILQYLVEVNACVGGEIVETIPLAQPTISRHLKELKSVGLIQGKVEGNHTHYCIDPQGWHKVQELFTSFFHQKIDERDCC